MIRSWIDKKSGKIVVTNEKTRMELTKPQAYVLLRQLSQLLGLRVSLGKPIVSYRFEGSGYVVDVIEGGETRRFVVPTKIIEAYMRAVKKLGSGKYQSSTIAKEAFIQARKLGISEVSRFMDGDDLNWELLFGTRDKYYELFRVPILVLQEMGYVKYGKRFITILPRNKRVDEFT
jgi:hypothetical protein